MICFVVLLAVASSVSAGYAGSSSNKVGDGYGYGYSGSYSGDTGAGAALPQFPEFDFNNFLQSYFDSLRKYHEQIAAHTLSYSYAISDPHSRAQAQSSLKFHNKRIQQGPGYAGYGFPGGFPAYADSNIANLDYGGYEGGYGGQEGAAASASIGPQGIHQTAKIYPEDPNYPNVNTRFASSGGGGGNDGFYSVSTSSRSGSSNVDGKPSSYHQASTTVNDNGKVTTYTVKKP